MLVALSVACRCLTMHIRTVLCGHVRPCARRAVWLAIGLWVLLMPASVGARPLARA